MHANTRTMESKHNQPANHKGDLPATSSPAPTPQLARRRLIMGEAQAPAAASFSLAQRGRRPPPAAPRRPAQGPRRPPRRRMQQRADGRRRPRAVPTPAQAPVAPPRRVAARGALRRGAVWPARGRSGGGGDRRDVAVGAAPPSPSTPTPSPRRSSRPCC